MNAADRALRFPDRETSFRCPPGCRKVRRGDETRVPSDDGSPSPASGRRQPTGRFAPRGGTVSAAGLPKGSMAMATVPVVPGRRAARFGAASPSAVQGLPSVDTVSPSDKVEMSKKVEISRGLAVFFPSRPEPWGARCTRFERSVAAVRSTSRRVRPSSAKRTPLCGVSRGVVRQDDVMEIAGGTHLARLGRREASPRGAGSRTGSVRHERVRFGVGQAWVRSGRDASDLFDGSVRS
jgi:hypothetical protein